MLCVGQIFKTVMFPVGSPVEITNPLPVSQARSPQFRVIERFCALASTTATIVGHSSEDLNFLILLRTLGEGPYGHFRLCAN